jgi:hypothetical protein
VLSLYDDRTGRVEKITMARPGVVRVSCAAELRPVLVADLVRRLAGHHRIRAIGIWPSVPGAADLNVRSAELTSGEADVHLEETVGPCALASADGLDPLAVRFALLSRHYRTGVSLGRADLDAAEATLAGLRRSVAGWAESPGRPPDAEYVAEAVGALDADLDTPLVFEVLSRLTGDPSVPPGGKFETVIKLDMILGLDLVALVGRL